MHDLHTSPAPRPPLPPVANPVRKFVLSVPLILLASATVVFWPGDQPSPIAIAESGFHLLPAPASDEQDAVWAVVVENTGTETTGETRLRFTYRDDDGSSDDSQSHILPPLGPGERHVATGIHAEEALQGGHFATRDGLSGLPIEMTVDVDADLNVSPSDRGRPSVIAVDDVWAGWGVDPLDREVLAIAVDPESEPAPGRPFGMVLVFRDAEDLTIGGRTLIVSHTAGRPLPDDEPRQLFATVEAEELPADLASIEVQVLENAI